MSINIIIKIVATIVAFVSAVIYIRMSHTSKEIEEKRAELRKKIEDCFKKETTLDINADNSCSAVKQINLTPKERITVSAGAFLVMVFAAVFLSNIFVVILGGVLAYYLPGIYLRWKRSQEYKLKIRLLKPALRSIASAHSFQPNIISAIQQAIPGIQSPLKEDFEQFLMDTEMGMPLDKALEKLRQTVNVSYMDFFVRVIQIAQEEGGRDTHALIKTTADLIDSDMMVMEEFETEIVSQKKDAYQLFILQFAGLALVWFQQPEQFAFYTETIFGQVFIAYMILITIVLYEKANTIADSILQGGEI